MSQPEIQTNEFESMSTLDLLRAYHKAVTRLQALKDRDPGVAQYTKEMDTEWGKLNGTRKGAQTVLETRGAKFINGNFNLQGSTQEIKDLIANNKPE